MKTLTCKWCHQEKPLSHFHKRNSVRSGYVGYCKTCATDPHRIAEYAKHGKGKRLQRKNDLKRCAKCRRYLPPDEFYKGKRYGREELYSYCKTCHKITMEPYRAVKADCCQACGFIALDPCQLDVDHKDNDKNNNDVTNLWTLCVNCHRLKTSRPELFYRFLKKQGKKL